MTQFHENSDSDNGNYTIEKLKRNNSKRIQHMLSNKNQNPFYKDRKKTLDILCHKKISQKTSQMFLPTKASD